MKTKQTVGPVSCTGRAVAARRRPYIALLLALCSLPHAHAGAARTAAAAAAPAPDQPTGHIVDLPPLLVEEGVKVRPWLYAEIPGMIVLSRCSSSTTTEFIRGEFRAQQLLNLILPESLRAKYSQPRLMVLSTKAQTATAEQV